MWATLSTLGSAHPDSLISQRNLAGLLQDLGKPRDVKPLYQGALADYKSTLGPPHPCMLNHGVTAEGREPLAREALAGARTTR